MEVEYDENRSNQEKEIIELFFESNFEKNKVIIETKKSKVFEGKISTDHTIGVAEHLSFKRPESDTLFLSLYKNDGSVIMKRGSIPIKGFNNLYISYLRDDLKIFVTNKKKYYK